MPSLVSNVAAAALNGKIFVIGGYTDIKNYENNRLYEYDPATDTWAIRKSMSSVILGFALAACQNKIYVMGGITFTNLGSGAYTLLFQVIRLMTP